MRRASFPTRQKGGLINRTGYLKGAETNQNPINVIPSSHITTQGMSAPIYANGIKLNPDTGDYHFPTPFVVETKVKKRRGGRLMHHFQQGGNAEPNGPITFLNSYYQSPEFKRKFVDREIAGQGWIPPSIKDGVARRAVDRYNSFMSDLSQTKYRPYVPTGQDDPGRSFEELTDKRGLRGPNITLSGKQAQSLGANLYNTILPHEYSHLTRGDLSNHDAEYISNLSQHPGAYNLSEKEQVQKGIFNSHTVDPNEQYPDMNSLRWLMYKYNIYDSRKGKMTMDDFNKALTNPSIKGDYSVKRLLEEFTPENLIQFNNTIATNNPSPVPQSRWGGKTVTTPQYLTTYPENKTSMKQSFRGKMRVGGQHFDPQLGNYKSNIYATGGLAQPGYPYAGYNDSMRHLFSGMMQAGGINIGNASRALSSGYDDVSYLDDVNGILSGNTKMGRYSDPAQSQLAMQAYLWHQQNAGRSPDQTIGSFYQRPMGNSPADSLRGKLNSIGRGPVGMYHDTPNISVNPGNSVATAYRLGGNMKTGGKHWIQGAVNPAHKGYCTPMSKPTCTGHRRALAMLFKHKHGFHKKQEGGEYLQGMEMQQGGYPPNYTPAGPVYNMGSYGPNWTAPLTGQDSANYLRDYNEARNNPNESTNKLTHILNVFERNEKLKKLWDPKRPSGTDSGVIESFRPFSNSYENYQNSYEDANTPGTMRLNLPQDVHRPKKRRGGYQAGGLMSFGAAGSDQNQWSVMNASNITSPMANYRKSGPSLASQGSQPRDIGAQFGTPGHGSATIPTLNSYSSRSFGSVNPTNLSWLLPLNAGLSAMSQNNQYRQNDSWRRSNLNNPLVTEGYADGRPQEVRYGYQYGGVNQTSRSSEGYMSFAGRPMRLWQRGGDTGAARQLRPYMLHQGSFQAGGLLDQWDYEDAQDQQDQPAPEQQEEAFATDDTDLQRRADLSDEDDYNNALRIAMDGLPEFTWASNPYLS